MSALEPQPPTIWGFYHNPPTWMDREPPGLGEDPFPQSVFASMRDEVFRTTIADKLELRITREGVFAFDFTCWPEALLKSDESWPIFEREVAVKLTQISVMNAFLALMYTAEFRNATAVRPRMLLSPQDLYSFAYIEGRPMTITYKLSQLHESSDPTTYASDVHPRKDPRLLLRVQSTPVSILEEAAGELEDLITRFPEDGLQLADLFLRASKDYQEYDFAASLITNWAITEKMIQELWGTYLSQNRDRDGESFIKRERFERLRDGRTYTVSVLIEVLSLIGIIEPPLYAKLSTVRKLRNDWIHSLKGEMTYHDAFLATEACEMLLNKARNLSFSGQRLLML